MAFGPNNSTPVAGLNVKMGRMNKNRISYSPPRAEDVHKLRMLMPMDIYLYEYAKQLHKVRAQRSDLTQNVLIVKLVVLLLRCTL